MSVCRGCLQQDPDFLLSLNAAIEEIPLGKMFRCLTGIRVSREGDLPRYICQQCADGLAESYKLRSKFLLSDKHLRSLLRQDPQLISFASEASEEMEVLEYSDHPPEEDEIEDEEEPIGSNYLTEDEEKSFTTSVADEMGTEQRRFTEEIKIEPLMGCTVKEQQKLGSSCTKEEVLSEAEYLIDEDISCEGTNTIENAEFESIAQSKTSIESKLSGHSEVMCCTCPGVMFASKDDLLQHSEKVHKKERYTKHIRPYECDICYKRFLSQAALFKHQEYPYRAKKYACKLCEARFHSRSAVLNHEKSTHIRTRSYECNVCQKAFFTQSTLLCHQLVHREKQFQCSVCDKQFGRKIDMLAHLQATHIDERPFSCDTCAKRFKTKAHLRHHCLVHSGSRPIKCKYCDKGFQTYSDRKVHQLKHENIDSFACKFCSKVYQRNYKLQVHVRKHHTGERPFECEYCEKKFVQRWELTKHYHKMHKVENTAKPAAEVVTIAGNTRPDDV
ncbi:zinc finger and SCAN domain-containing protein 31-like [Anopheles cruzii]|uniref:zinc finger and SCAN domain-containing protein 31-like n=1 Tax=Anopheles cruzii TaxID=68878 RepID=UPI0022EC78A4|nr:zinc finger and SCAN domain-containing protein 31-like [Anopheles cruzii]